MIYYINLHVYLYCIICKHSYKKNIWYKIYQIRALLLKDEEACHRGSSDKCTISRCTYLAINVKQCHTNVCMYVRVCALISIARKRARVLVKPGLPYSALPQCRGGSDFSLFVKMCFRLVHLFIFTPQVL